MFPSLSIFKGMQNSLMDTFSSDDSILLSELYSTLFNITEAVLQGKTNNLLSLKFTCWRN